MEHVGSATGEWGEGGGREGKQVLFDEGTSNFVQSEHTDKNVPGLTRVPWYLRGSLVFCCVSFFR